MSAEHLVTRRYTYQPRMSAAELSDAMNRLRLTAWRLSRLTGIDARRIRRMLVGDDGFEVPVILQMSLYVWERNTRALRQAEEFADLHAMTGER